MAARIVSWAFVLGSIATIATAVAAAQQAAAPNREPLAETNSDEDRIFAALETITDISFNDASLDDVAEWIRKQHGVKVTVDKKALIAEGFDAATKLSLTLRQVSLEAVLHHLLRRHDITVTIANDALVLTGRSVDDALTRRAYRVDDLVNRRDATGKQHRDAEPLLVFVTSHCGPTSWDAVGGSGTIEFDGDSMVVPQTCWMYREIKDQLARLRRVLKRNAAGDLRAEDMNAQPSDAKVNAALGKKIDLLADKMSLPKFAKCLSEETGLNVLIDERDLTDAGLVADELQLTGKPHGVPLRDALRAILREQGLVYYVNREVLFISSASATHCTWPTRTIYPAAGLLSDGRDQDEQAQKLKMYVTETVAPSSWETVGGSATFLYEPHWNLLFISQYPDIKPQVEEVLAGIRKANAAKLARQARENMKPVSPAKGATQAK
jgi:hypothetical protein